jgi:hypothetical protein
MKLFLLYSVSYYYVDPVYIGTSVNTENENKYLSISFHTCYY